MIQSTPPMSASGLLFQRFESEAPALQQPVGFLVAPPQMCSGPARGIAIECRARRSVLPFSRRTIQALVASREMSRVLWTASARMKFLRQTAFFEQRENAGGGPDFQRGRERAHVGIADQQMEPAILSVIGQRLVARIDDGAVELHPLVNVVDDVIGALAELKIDLRPPAAAARNRTRADSPAPPGRRR